MPTPKNGKTEPLRVIGSISKLVGTVVGTTVVTGKRVIRSVRSLSESLSDKPGKTVHAPAPAKRKKKAVRKAGVKIPKTKKKKVVKRKGTGSSGVSRASKKTPKKSPAKKKKGVTLKKKTTHLETRSEGSSYPQVGLISEIDTGTNVPIEEQEPQL
ncbi:MAG: hypothetical protein FVQ84_13100 [Planctomycetes bacterium]|nr:hypothetical protein [Planctomycetota bacterium]